MPAQRNAPQLALLEELNQDIGSGKITVSNNAEVFFDEVTHRFPLEGSKIAWATMPDCISRTINYDDYNNSITDFFELVVVAAGLSSADSIIVIGDSALDVALSMSIGILRKHLINIVEMPQHTYVLPKNADWCACYTLEGFMDFGFSPSVIKAI